MKKPTQTDLKESLIKHKDKLATFYQRKDIKKITEDQLMLGEESMSIMDPEIAPQQQSALSNSLNNVPDFKNQMAKEVLKAITKTPKKTEQIPSLLVATSFGGEMDSEGSPNADKGVKDLRRKFEEKEADIITDLYARHFKSKGEADAQSKAGKDDSALDVQDSIGEQGFILDMTDDLTNKDRKPEGRASNFQHANGAPNPETYSKPLKDTIRYVQYIPKEARGTLEDVVNQLYHQKEIHRRVTDEEKEKNESKLQVPSPTR